MVSDLLNPQSIVRGNPKFSCLKQTRLPLEVSTMTCSIAVQSIKATRQWPVEFCVWHIDFITLHRLISLEIILSGTCFLIA